MTIETKYNIEEKAWMLYNNHAEQVEIVGIETTVIKHYYSTNPIPIICEPASGENHLADVFSRAGHNVRTTDIVQRTPTTEVLDFLSLDNQGSWHGDIVTNPPYKWATEFIYRALQLVREGNKVAMFLKLQFLEGKERKELFRQHPPKTVYVSSSRIMCAKNGQFEQMKAGGGSAVAYAWFVWEKGYKGETIIKWIN